MKITLGVIFDQNLRAGGGFTQSFQTVKFLNSMPNDLFEPIYFTTFKENLIFFKKENIKVTLLNFNYFQKFIMKISTLIKQNRLYTLFNNIFGINALEKILIKKDIDLVYFLSPSSWSLYLNHLNYIITVWDLCHRSNPEFNETGHMKIFSERENFYFQSLPKATAIITDSLSTKYHLMKYYNLVEDKIKIVEFQNQFHSLSEINDDKIIINNFNINSKYVFYPAQFWPHKNHAYIIDGIKILKEEYNLNFEIVFTGTDKGNLKVVKNYAKKCNLDKYVHCLGFVSENDLIKLYKNSVALIMPSFFGPNNIPPLEAFHYGIPVLYTDFNDLSQDFKDSIFPLNLDDPYNFAFQLNNVINNTKLKNLKIKNGKKFLKLREEKKIEDLKTYNNIFKKYINKLKTWKD